MTADDRNTASQGQGTAGPDHKSVFKTADFEDALKFVQDATLDNKMENMTG